MAVGRLLPVQSTARNTATALDLAQGFEVDDRTAKDIALMVQTRCGLTVGQDTPPRSFKAGGV